jgi:hypothetical protein
VQINQVVLKRLCDPESNEFLSGTPLIVTYLRALFSYCIGRTLRRNGGKIAQCQA